MRNYLSQSERDRCAGWLARIECSSLISPSFLFHCSPVYFSLGLSPACRRRSFENTPTSTHLPFTLIVPFFSYKSWVPISLKPWVSPILLRSLFFAHLVFSYHSGKLFGNKEMRLLMLGLDAAGKTSTFLLLRSAMHHPHSAPSSHSLQAKAQPVRHYYPNGYVFLFIVRQGVGKTNLI
jgi:hypothetical protein